MIERTSIVIFVLFSATFSLNYCLAESCVKQNPCLCEIEDDTKIDISTLMSSLTPQYLEDSQGNRTYYFSGCRDANVTVNTYQNGTAPKYILGSLIQVENGKNSPDITVLGLAHEIHFNKNAENKYEIVYNNNHTSKIELICDDFKVPLFKTIDSINKEFAIASPKACLVVEPQGMSGGSKFIIVLIIIISVYFIGGGLVMYLIRGARGIEVIPNIEFWRNLPGLVKDGIIFLLSGCRPTLVTSAETYDRI
ncbi:unnamed protein product [Phaedon cochleariae]|uniref:Autophagy-related protein 27 n=1 Tax=Phaedon cochleariae TaxID=80249 RepID=A0A9P0DCT1_PHACE|nr:unnamed protein product [Phaedon cochleariae]